MSRACRLLMGAILLLFIATPAFSQQANIQGERTLVEVARRLDARVGRLIGHGTDFGDYSRSSGDSAQFLLLHCLGDEAARAAATLQAAQIMLLLYTYTLFHPARTDARAMVQQSLDSYTEKLDASIARVNDLISTTRSAAAVHSAWRMKDDLRETVDILKSIELP